MNARKSGGKSPRQKGKRFERSIAKQYRAIGIEARAMPMSGGAPGGFMKGDIAKRVYDGWIDECKNAERVTFWQFWEQARSQATIQQKPVLHITGNHREEVTVMRTSDYMQLRKLEIEALEYVARKMRARK